MGAKVGAVGEPEEELPFPEVATTPPAAAAPATANRMISALLDPPVRFPGTLMLNCVTFVRAVRPL
jgi:hypothetical protein